MSTKRELQSTTNSAQTSRPFLVKQSPAIERSQDFESTMLGSQLNKHGSSVSNPACRPTDRYNVVFLILVLHGIGTLMPWNLIINAEDYFRNYKLASSNGTNSTLTLNQEADLTKVRNNFLFYIGIAAQVPNVIFNGLNLVLNLGTGDLGLRVNITLIIEAVIFIFTIVLAVLDTTQWKLSFFYITLISVVVLNMASGVYQNSVFGIGAKFPGSYTNAILIGSNLCGTFISTVNLLCIWLAPAPEERAIYYFVTALFVIVACIVTYNLLKLNSFYNYFDQLKNRIGSTSDNRDESDRELVETATLAEIPETFRETVDFIAPKPAETEANSSYVSEISKNWMVLKKCWPQCLNVLLTFYVTLALFPTVLADIGSVKGFMNKEYFSSVACFLIFNLFALIGNLLSSQTTWPGERGVRALVIARFLFVPFFLFCNYKPTSRRWPVLIQSDKIYMIGNMLLALSNGYLSSLCMMFASRNLPLSEAPKAGMLAAFFLVLGIFLGVNSSLILSWIVELG